MRRLPLEGHAHMLGNSILYFETDLDSGTERVRTEFKRGDVAFLPSSRSICFFLSDVIFKKAMTPIGRLTGNFDILKDIKPGDVLCMYQEVSAAVVGTVTDSSSFSPSSATDSD